MLCCRFIFHCLLSCTSPREPTPSWHHAALASPAWGRFNIGCSLGPWGWEEAIWSYYFQLLLSYHDLQSFFGEAEQREHIWLALARRGSWRRGALSNIP
jgi:hypothetical protein